MDGAILQPLIYKGYAQAANHMGLPFVQYRPAAAINPLQSTPVNTALNAAFNVLDMKFSKSAQYAKATWYCVADGRLLQQGDYLSGNGKTYFIAAMDALLPILAVLCNRTVAVYRPQQQGGVGAEGYGGNTAENQRLIVGGFPASLLSVTKAERGDVGLPGDVRNAWAELLLPTIPENITLEAHDVVKDDLGNRYVISGAELSELGWRCTLQQSES